ncbi:MAG: hypothetical protein JWO36_3977 [Myxococcales bacterium]|nr:hypothetical protein [Myxococcales bacterium]
MTAAAVRVAASCCRSWHSRTDNVIVTRMTKHRDLASVVYEVSVGRTTASRIWRTVVFAGAMLGAPLGCGGGNKKADTAASDKASADKAAADQAAADKTAADKAAADQAAADQAAADKVAADKVAADKAAEDATREELTKRPRGGNGRPKGRGFVLA